MDSSFDSSTIAERFGLPRSPTLLSHAGSDTPLAFSRITSNREKHPRTLAVPPESAYSFQVMLKPLASDVWIGRRHIWVADAAPGNTYMFDLGTDPTTAVRTSFDFIRFYMPQAALDDLAVRNGLPPQGNLQSGTFGRHDGVMHGLALAIAEAIERPNDATALFMDYIGLAFHSHVVLTYGRSKRSGGTSPGTLAPWQFRRARDYILANLDGNPSVAELARECALSPNHFARAFKRTTGLPPHSWMTAKRLERAKTLLRHPQTDLADVAVNCGFSDQSHFTRVFVRHEGKSPGRWRSLQDD